MGVCKSVSILAQSVLDDCSGMEARQELQLQLLKLGPLYLEISNLPLWESALQNTFLDEDDESTVGILINELYELAMFNMYGAFDISQTVKFGAQVIETLKDNGVSISINSKEFECW